MHVRRCQLCHLLMNGVVCVTGHASARNDAEVLETCKQTVSVGVGM